MKSKRSFNVAAVNAEFKALMVIQKFEQEFEQDGNQNQRGGVSQVRQADNAQGNVPNSAPTQVQQPGY